jgi:hypothetical protein
VDRFQEILFVVLILLAVTIALTQTSLRLDSQSALQQMYSPLYALAHRAPRNIGRLLSLLRVHPTSLG